MIRRPLLLLPAALGVLSGCATERGTVSDTCLQLIECVDTVAATSASATNSAYGAKSECWADATSADACTAECQTALEDYHAEDPTQPACDDGVVIGSNILFPSGAHFAFQSQVNNAQCDPEINVSLVQLDLQSDVTPTFSWSGTINGTDAGAGFESDYASTCDLDGSEWTCVQDPTAVTVGDVSVGHFDFNGTFSADGSASTASLFYDIESADGTCNQSQSMSGAQPS